MEALPVAVHILCEGKGIYHTIQCNQHNTTVAVSCGYDTCFVVKTCDGLYHFIFSIDSVGFQPVLWTFEIDQIHLSIEAQCVTTLLPLGDCHNNQQIFDLHTSAS